MVKIKKILFPIDLTHNASKVFPYVLSVSEKYGGEICLLHVVEDFIKWGIGIYIPHPPLEQYREDALKGAEKALDKACEEQLQGQLSEKNCLRRSNPGNPESHRFGRDRHGGNGNPRKKGIG